MVLFAMDGMVLYGMLISDGTYVLARFEDDFER